MSRILLALTFLLFACSSKAPRSESAMAGAAPAFALDQALQEGEKATLSRLKTQTTVKSFGDFSERDPARELPLSLRAEKPASISRDKIQQQQFLKKFHNWSLKRKLRHSHQLAENFQCGDALEAQSMGFSLEIDFPDTDASAMSQTLLEKGLVCQAFTRQESLLRLAIFAIQRGECGQATDYLDSVPQGLERGVNDRVAYLRGLCTPSVVVTERNPWGGYGILLNEAKGNGNPHPTWSLSVSSGDVDWDRLLVSFIELEEKGRHETVQYLASKINYEKFRSLPLPFQTSMLVLLNFSGADLPVFQTLHHYLSEHPEQASPAVMGLLFPVRYWEKILENSKSVDPVLVKALIRQESAFNPGARSRARAAGLMQLVYPTAKHFGIHRPKELLDPEANIHAGSEFLAHLINEFGSVELALAAYNAGPALVHQWQKRYPTANMDLFVEMIPYTETREYVRLVRRNYKIYQSILAKPQTVTGNGL